VAAPRVVVVVNPISGTGGRGDVARRRAELASSHIANRGFGVDVHVTERPGHARELAHAAAAAGVSTIVAWGGDGTVNEVGSALAFRPVTLGIVPGGSGNGLARELGVPFDPARALDVALSGRARQIDAGDLDGRLFFNVAGIGLDACVAHRFAGGVRRGFTRYAAVTLQELFAYVPEEHSITADGRTLRARTLVIALANTRQYGNGAVIAPDAVVDDGRLDLVVISARPLARALVQLPRLFTGGITRLAGVTSCSAAAIQVTASRPMLLHVDGEPATGGASLAARVHPRALRVAVPA
jgi:YegS/Rv2252/BmrU family lipid kinase